MLRLIGKRGRLGVLSNVGTVRYLLDHPKGHTLSEMSQPLDPSSEAGTQLIKVSDPMAALAELRSVYNPELDFRKLALETKYFSRGMRLIKDADGSKFGKDALIGVPHVIISVTYREGYLSDKIQGDYISCEAVVADKETMNSAQVRAQLGKRTLEVYPNEAVVYNDGGTGVRREITRTLHLVGLIDVGGNYDKDGERIYDRPYSQWKSGAQLAQDGIVADTDGEKFRYFAMRGLTRSDYDSPFGPATTYYIG